MGSTSILQLHHLARAQSLIDFHTRHHRLPSTRSQDPSEVSLARWRVKHKLAPDRAVAELLDARLPGWSQNLIARPEGLARADELIRFVTEHGRFPKSYPKHGFEHELYRRLLHYRTASPAGITRHLDEHLPGWRTPASAGTTHRSPTQWARALIRFHHTHGRLPARTAQAPAQERSLGNWLARTRRDGTTPAATALLERGLPGWDRPRTRRSRMDRAGDLIRFHRQHGRMPGYGASAGAEERSMARWVSQARALPPTDPARTLLDQNLPGWA